MTLQLINSCLASGARTNNPEIGLALPGTTRLPATLINALFYNRSETRLNGILNDRSLSDFVGLTIKRSFF